MLSGWQWLFLNFIVSLRKNHLWGVYHEWIILLILFLIIVANVNTDIIQQRLKCGPLTKDIYVDLEFVTYDHCGQCHSLCKISVIMFAALKNRPVPLVSLVFTHYLSLCLFRGSGKPTLYGFCTLRTKPMIRSRVHGNGALAPMNNVACKPHGYIIQLFDLKTYIQFF